MDSLTQFHDIFRFSRKKVVTLINVRQPVRTVESQFNENRFLFQPVKNLFAIIYLKCCFRAAWPRRTRSSVIAEGPRDASCELKSCQLPSNSAETTNTTSADQIDGMKLEI